MIVSPRILRVIEGYEEPVEPTITEAMELRPLPRLPIEVTIRVEDRDRCPMRGVLFAFAFYGRIAFLGLTAATIGNWVCALVNAR